MCEREVKRKGEGRGKEGGQAGRCTQELDTSVQDTPPSCSVQILLAFRAQNEGSGPGSLS